MKAFIPHEQIPSPAYHPNELRAELTGLPAINPFLGLVSGPRAAMFNKHIAQRQTLENGDSQRLQTGVGYELGKYTYQIKIPADSYIFAVVHKYGKSINYDGVIKNPLSTVIFERTNDRVIDIVDLVKYHSQHQYFGFEYKYNPDSAEYIRPGARTIDDVVVADSPAKAPDGDYYFGLHTNIMLCSDPAVIEDGIKISESYAKRLSFSLFESRTITFGNNVIGLNLYGNEDVYKTFPNIGEKIRDDGVLFATREMNDELTPCDLSLRSLQRIDLYDTCIYGKPGAEVVDIEIIKGDTNSFNMLDVMESQLEFHHHAQLEYYTNILHQYNRLKEIYKDSLKLSNKFKNLIRTAIAVKAATNTKNKVKIAYRGKVKLNGWMVKVTYKYKLTPVEGFKQTDLMGGKGVAVAVVPDERMPINDIGIRTDVIMDNQAPYRRTIMGKFHEIAINACLDKVLYDIKEMCADGSDASKLAAYDYIMGFYKIVSPMYYELGLDPAINKVKHITEILRGNVGIGIPSDNPVDYMEVIDLLEQYYPPCYGPVKFVGHRGEQRTTKSPILIGGFYNILLDKIATEVAAVSSAKTQHFGIPSTLTKTNKYYSPYRNQPTKTLSEDDVRALEAIVGGEVTADLIDQTNNPEVHKTVLRNIYDSLQPTAIYTLVDRDKQPTGHGYIQNMVNNVLSCAGIEIVPSNGVE